MANVEVTFIFREDLSRYDLSCSVPKVGRNRDGNQRMWVDGTSNAVGRPVANLKEEG